MKLIFGALFAAREVTAEGDGAEYKKAMVEAWVVSREISHWKQTRATPYR
jgi:hypothetical protein